MRLSRKETIRNVIIRQQIGIEETIIKETEQNQLTWYGHVQRMAEGTLPKHGDSQKIIRDGLKLQIWIP